MDLTEPQAGSDVGAVETSAKKLADGTYAITGNKIFITNGEHDLVDNIIHPVLARVEGAAKGTRGISIFIVPKFWVNDDGSLGERNDILCTGVEEKMGIHASATCSMAMGGRGICRGMLLGKENQGMRIMFHMMNEARLDVGFMGFSQASAAYLLALAYARERVQGRDLERGRDPDAPPVAIIRHPDVRRMLTWMKAHVDGMRSFIYYVCTLFDRLSCAGTEQEGLRANGLIEFFTPVVKAYCAARGFEVCVQAMQVHGGYGYIRDYAVEQRARDAKIASIFEGTDGIQAMDFLGRKLEMNDGAVFKDFLGEIDAIVTAASRNSAVAGLAERVSAAAARLRETATRLRETAATKDFKVAYAHAHPFLEVTGDVIMAWMLLWRAKLAADRLTGSLKATERDFYRGQVSTAEFYIRTVLPSATGKMAAILGGSRAALDISERGFGG
jgi:alkylation response protein AidB-like acyl-CoA dehydrogenase